MRKEVSSGGLVVRDGKVLMVEVQNLLGQVVWTFPKGHLEKGEGPRRAALREVEEETGWACRIKGPLMTARYEFRRGGRKVSKRVKWYWMAPLKRTGGRDADEIQTVRWAALARAEKLISYPSDCKLLKVFVRRLGE